MLTRTVQLAIAVALLVSRVSAQSPIASAADEYENGIALLESRVASGPLFANGDTGDHADLEAVRTIIHELVDHLKDGRAVLLGSRAVADDPQYVTLRNGVIRSESLADAHRTVKKCNERLATHLSELLSELAKTQEELARMRRAEAAEYAQAVRAQRAAIQRLRWERQYWYSAAAAGRAIWQWSVDGRPTGWSRATPESVKAHYDQQITSISGPIDKDRFTVRSVALQEDLQQLRPLVAAVRKLSALVDPMEAELRTALIQQLSDGLDSGDADTRRRAVAAIGQHEELIGHFRARLRTLASEDPSASVRSEAEAALRSWR